MSRPRKTNPTTPKDPTPGVLPKREAETAKRQAKGREAARGEKPRVVVGSAAARALGIM